MQQRVQPVAVAARGWPVEFGFELPEQGQQIDLLVLYVHITVLLALSFLGVPLQQSLSVLRHCASSSMPMAVVSILSTFPFWRTSVRSTNASVGQYQSVTLMIAGSVGMSSSPIIKGPSEVRFS